MDIKLSGNFQRAFLLIYWDLIVKFVSLSKIVEKVLGLIYKYNYYVKLIN